MKCPLESVFVWMPLAFRLVMNTLLLPSGTSCLGRRMFWCHDKAATARRWEQLSCLALLVALSQEGPWSRVLDSDLDFLSTQGRESPSILHEARQKQEIHDTGAEQ